jgi:crotonobetainyl-CoA:carnitine CoA-transferase CaiB-like acyl-CoA transferase
MSYLRTSPIWRTTTIIRLNLRRDGGSTVADVPQVLEGIRVVDVTTGPVGGIATMVLADFGADVVKVEPPGGDRFRALAASPLWLRGKRSVTADLATDTGRADVWRIVAAADVLVVSGPPSRSRRWGLDADAALALQPELVHCSITGWGPLGPLAEVPAYEAAVAARSGRMMAFQRQLRRGGPVFTSVPVAGHVAAHGAVQGIAAALLARSRGGGGQRVETSLLQGLLPFDLVELLLVEMAERSGLDAPDITAAGGDMPTLNYHPVRTADGRWIQCGNLLEHLLMAFLDATDLLGALLADERFTAPPGTWDEVTVDAARNMILVRLQERSADEWMEAFRDNGHVAAEPFLTTAEALWHPDIVGAGDIVTLDDPVHGPVRTIGPIAELTATPAAVGKPAPRAGDHDGIRLFEGIGAPGSGPKPSDALRHSDGCPLDGITVVEFATIIAAPLATTMLADLGARVIKVELIDGDPYRHLIPGGTPVAKTSAGKASICIDVKHEEGRRIAADLARTADVVVHNARPGVPERLGLGDEQLRAANPHLVWVAVSGYGRRSAAAGRPSTHPCAGAATGGAAFQAGPALTAPCETLDDVREISRQLMRANESNPDPNTAVVTAAAVTLALLARERFGVGQAVYVNMLAANLYANADDALAYSGKPDRAASDDELHGPAALYRLYRAGEGWLFLAAGSDAEWARVTAVLDRPDLRADQRFATAAGRAAHEAELATELADSLGKRSAGDWEARFAAAGVAGVRADASTPGPFFAHHEQVLANGFTPDCTHARFGPYRRWGPVVRVNGGPPVLGPGVLAGENTDEILASLGCTPTEIAALRADGVVASEPVEWE